MERHTWREKTEEGLRFVRASHHGGNWTLQSQLKGGEEWITHEPITPDEWRTLREVLWRKYQRGRGAWKLIAQIDKLLEAAGEKERENQGQGHVQGRSQAQGEGGRA